MFWSTKVKFSFVKLLCIEFTDNEAEVSQFLYKGATLYCLLPDLINIFFNSQKGKAISKQSQRNYNKWQFMTIYYCVYTNKNCGAKLF